MYRVRTTGSELPGVAPLSSAGPGVRCPRCSSRVS